MTRFDEGLERYARGNEKEMAGRVATAAGRESTRARIARGRRLRAVRQGGMAVVVTAALAVGAWLIPAWGDEGREPASPTPWDGSMTGARIGDVAPLPDVYGWQQVEGATPPLPFCTGQYEPPTEPGLTIRSEAVPALGIGIETTLVGAPPRVGDEPVRLTSDEYPYVAAEISWSGDRALQVTGYAVLVSNDGKLVSIPSVDVGILGGSQNIPGGKPFAARFHSEWNDRTKVPVEIWASPYDCGSADLTSYAYYAQFDGDYTLHTVFQVSDEAGVPLATFVDATEIAAVPVHVEETTAKWDAIDAGFAAAVDTLRRRVDTEGIALSETTAGLGKRNVAETCEAADALWAESGPDLPVVDAGPVAIAFPDTLSRADLGGSLTFDSPPAIVRLGLPWYYGAEYLVLRRVTADGVDHAAFGVTVTPGARWGDQGADVVITGSIGFSENDRGCGNTDALAGLEPGIYQAAMVVTATPWSPELWELFDGHGRVGDFWVNLGEVTITD